MFSTFQYILIIIITSCALLIRISCWVQFALISELVWIGVYSLTTISGVLLNDSFLLSLPFVILLLMATEAVLVWLIFSCNT